MQLANHDTYPLRTEGRDQAFAAADEASVPAFATSRVLLPAMLVVAALLMVVSAVLFQEPRLLSRDKVLTDFDAFYVAGTMVLEGRASDAYDMEATREAQRKFADSWSFMPWTYPPPFTLFVAGLAEMPIGLSYLLFSTASFGFYLMVLRRIAGPYLPGVLIAILPMIVLTLRTGQNGFLTGGLIGAFLVAYLNRRTLAAVPLGLMIIKPHLAAGIGLLVLVERRWKVVAGAAAVVVLSLLLSTAALGIEIWPAFVQGVRDSSAFLAEGYYPLHRMTSIYATLRSVGVPADVALAIHGAGALIAVAAFLLLWRLGLQPRILAAVVCVASLFVSPYNYDYDLAILGVAIAFVLPDILVSARRYELALLYALAWFATGYGLMLSLWSEDQELKALSFNYPALMTPVLLLLVAGATVLVRRGGNWRQPAS